MFLRFIFIVACISASFHFMDEYYSCVCVYHNLFMHAFIVGHLDCFHLLNLQFTIVHSTAMNFVSEYLFPYPILVLWSTYLGVNLMDYMVILCLSFEELPNCFHNDYTILPSHQQCMKVLIC